MAFKFVCLFALLAVVNCASIADNEVTPRINNGEELVSSVVNDCFHKNAMSCMKTKVLTYLDTMLGMQEEYARNYQSNNIDKTIYERVGKLLDTREFRVTLPETVFQSAEISYRADRGLDVELPSKPSDDIATVEARGILKKKLLLPVLLLLKLKMKALMPIFVALIGLKALKALILSKLAITLVAGFLIVQLMKKGGMPMPMTVTPAEPLPYGAPAPTSAPASSYEPGWEPNTGGPYARVWEPSSAQNLAYSGYYPSGSSSSSTGSSQSSSSLSSSSL